MSADLLPLLSDTDRDLDEAVTDAVLILDETLSPRLIANDDRPVDFDDDYREDTW